MPTIETVTGNSNLQEGSAQCRAFVVLPRDAISNRFKQEEKHLGQAVKDAAMHSIITNVGRAVPMSAVTDLSKEQSGTVCRACYQVSEGTIIKVMFQKRGEWGKGVRTANIYLRVREEAAHRRFVMRLNNNPSATERDAFIEGRFDVLTPDEAAGYGVTTKDAFKKLFEPAKQRAAGVNEVVLDEAVSRKPTHEVVAEIEGTEGKGGVRRKVTRRRRRRGIQLGDNDNK